MVRGRKRPYKQVGANSAWDYMKAVSHHLSYKEQKNRFEVLKFHGCVYLPHGSVYSIPKKIKATKSMSCSDHLN